jgi:uncharacterized membrane protein YeaQ/YmgE (transglycosylase-associated protein family)
MPFFLQFLLWILVGAFSGWLTGKKMRGYGYGSLMDTLMGAAGAVAAAVLVGATELLGWMGMVMTLPASALGAVVLTGCMALMSGERRHA